MPGVMWGPAGSTGAVKSIGPVISSSLRGLDGVNDAVLVVEILGPLQDVHGPAHARVPGDELVPGLIQVFLVAVGQLGVGHAGDQILIRPALCHVKPRMMPRSPAQGLLVLVDASPIISIQAFGL